MRHLFKATTSACLFLSIAPLALAQNGPPEPKGGPPQQAGANPVVGTYVSNYEVEFVAGTPCQILQDAGFVSTCKSAQLIMLNEDGSVHASDNNSNLNARSDSVGIWSANTRSTYSARLLTIYYDANSNPVTIDVVDTTSQANADFSGTQGTFEARSYNFDQDYLDPNTTPNFINTGSFVTRRIN